jgi:hypothetical protein
LAFEKFDFKVGLAQAAKEFTKNESDSEYVFTGVAKHKSPISDDDLVAAYVDSDTRRQHYWKELRKRYLAAVRRGVSPEEAMVIFKTSNIPIGSEDSPNVGMFIAAGIYNPAPVTINTAAAAVGVNRNLPFGRIDAYMETVRGKSLDD